MRQSAKQSDRYRVVVRAVTHESAGFSRRLELAHDGRAVEPWRGYSVDVFFAVAGGTAWQYQGGTPNLTRRDAFRQYSDDVRAYIPGACGGCGDAS